MKIIVVTSIEILLEHVKNNKYSEIINKCNVNKLNS